MGHSIRAGYILHVPQNNTIIGVTQEPATEAARAPLEVTRATTCKPYTSSTYTCRCRGSHEQCRTTSKRVTCATVYEQGTFCKGNCDECRASFPGSDACHTSQYVHIARNPHFSTGGREQCRTTSKNVTCATEQSHNRCCTGNGDERRACSFESDVRHNLHCAYRVAWKLTWSNKEDASNAAKLPRK